jgi:hypothetical protein
MWACLNPVSLASRKPVNSPSSMRSRSALRRFSCNVRNFMSAVQHPCIAYCYLQCTSHNKKQIYSWNKRAIRSAPYIAGFLNGGSYLGNQCMAIDTQFEGEESSFVEFRRKVRAAEMLSSAMELLLRQLQFTDRLNVVVQKWPRAEIRL